MVANHLLVLCLSCTVLPTIPALVLPDLTTICFVYAECVAILFSQDSLLTGKSHFLVASYS